MTRPDTAPNAQAKLHQRLDLTEGPIAKTLVTFSLPILGASMLQSINGSINAIWVGRLLGAEALTATTNANLILIFLIGAVVGIGMAGTILIGQALGAKDLARAKRAVGATAIFFLTISLVLAVGGFALSAQVLRWMDTPPDAHAMAEAYLRVVFLSMPFLYMFALLVMVQRGAGDARTPFRFLALAAAFDILLNPLLISGWGPFPHLGVAGAATATLASQAIGVTSMFAYLRWRKADLMLRGSEWRYLLPEPELLRTIVFKGLPMGAQMLVISLSGIIMMSMINAHGAETAAAFGVAMQIWTYVQMPAMAIGAAASSMAAQNIGAQRWDRVERVALSAVLVNVALTGSLMVLLYILDPLIVALFLPGQAGAVAIAEHINNIAGWSFVLFGVTLVLFGVVRSTGATLPPLIILLISLFGVRIGFAETFEPLWGGDAIWWSFPISMIVSCGLTLAYYRWGGWRKARMAPAVKAGAEEAASQTQ